RVPAIAPTAKRTSLVRVNHPARTPPTDPTALEQTLPDCCQGLNEICAGVRFLRRSDRRYRCNQMKCQRRTNCTPDRRGRDGGNSKWACSQEEIAGERKACHHGGGR